MITILKCAVLQLPILYFTTKVYLFPQSSLSHPLNLQYLYLPPRLSILVILIQMSYLETLYISIYKVMAAPFESSNALCNVTLHSTYTLYPFLLESTF